MDNSLNLYITNIVYRVWNNTYENNLYINYGNL